jgi:hypothetical protein
VAVLIVLSNPKPNIGCAIISSQSTVLDADSYGPQSWFDLFELQGGMAGIRLPKNEILVGKTFYPVRQAIVTIPEPRACLADHESGRVFCSWYSSIASLINRSNLPSAASLTICWSHRSASNSVSQFAIRRLSSGFNWDISSSISLMLRILKEYAKCSGDSRWSRFEMPSSCYRIR